MHGLSHKREAVLLQGKKPGAEGHGGCLPVPRPDLWLSLQETPWVLSFLQPQWQRQKVPVLLAPIPAVSATPSPSLGTEFSGTPKEHVSHLLGAAPPASARPADIPSAHPDWRLSRGGGILSPGARQGPGHRLLTPRL